MAIPPGLPVWAMPVPPGSDPPVEQGISAHIRILPDKSWLVLPVGLDYAFPGETALSYDDGANLNWACQNIGTGGLVRMIGATYNCASTVNVPESVALMGPGPAACVLAYSGSGSAVSHHGSTDSFTPTFIAPGPLWGFCIDGSTAGAGAVGLDIGDGRYMNARNILVRHFNGAGSIGAWLVNRNTFTEMADFQLMLSDNTANVVMDVAGGLTSHMYSNYDFAIFANNNQDGLVVQGGSQPSRCNIRLRGNFQSGTGNTGAVVRITGAGSSMAQGFWDLGVESDGSGAVGHTTFVTAAAGNTFTTMAGILAYLSPGGATAFSPASLADNWNFQGIVAGDSNLSAPAQPAVPASGTTLTNHANDATVYVTGGTVTGISIMGQSTGLTSGSFHVPGNNGTIKLTYSAAPTWLWIWDTQ